jgi:hypothetical protein
MASDHVDVRRIWWPMRRRSRASRKQCRDQGTTVFVDPRTFTPYPDQWALLAGVTRLDLADVQRTGLRWPVVMPSMRTVSVVGRAKM